MNLAEIKKLVEIFNASDLSGLSLKQDNFQIKLDRHPPQTQTPISTSSPVVETQVSPTPVTSFASDAPAPKVNVEGGYYITSPMVGTFYRSPSPDAAAYVNIGDTVKKGQTIGIIEAMKIMNEIEAEFDCKIIGLEVNDAQPVEFGSNLIKVEKI